jgi:hypothetical protein
MDRGVAGREGVSAWRRRRDDAAQPEITESFSG